jgi:chemotaxis methyl-accepting protein methylase
LTDAALDPVLAHLVRLLALDLRDYRRETLERRVLTRMNAVGATSPGGYLAVLEADPDETRRLAEAMLVHVTGFFRDPGVFEALLTRVLTRLAAAARPLRAWTIGAASGEEAWSLAATLVAARGPEVEVLATDRDAPSLEVAAAGVYPLGALSEGLARLSPATRAATGALFDVSPAEAVARPGPLLRARVRFATHDLMGLRVAPQAAIVASFPLVLCRNVLVYFDERFRDVAGERLAAVVEPGGALVLGATEALPASARQRFAPWPDLDPRLRIFRRSAAPC